MLVPADKLVEAHLRGATPAVRMRTQDGRDVIIPAALAERAQQEGAEVVRQDGTPYAKGQAPRIVGRNASGMPIWGNAEDAKKPGFLESAGAALADAAKGLVGAAESAIAPPKTVGDRIATALGPPGLMLKRGIVDPAVEEAREAVEHARAGDVSEALGHGLAAITPGAGPWAAQVGEKVGEQWGEGNYAGAAGTLAGNAAAGIAGEVLPKGLKASREWVKGRLADLQAPAKTLDTPMATGEMTPRQRWQAAQGMGVNLDRAQATNATVPRILKAPTEHGLTGSPVFEENNAANVAAMHQHVDNLLDAAINPSTEPTAGARSYAKQPAMTREEFGNAAQEALEQHRRQMQEHERAIYEGLDERLGEQAPDVSAIQKKAQELYKANKRFYDAPETQKALQPGDKKVWDIVKMFAGVDKDGAIPKDAAAGASWNSWGGLQRWRSLLLDLTRGPEFISNHPLDLAKQMTGAVDQTMTSAENLPGLTAKDIQDFRDANALHTTLKTMYDDPKSPFYWTAREGGTPAANRLAQMSPENQRTFKTNLVVTGNEGLIGQAQRQAMARILDPAGNGVYDLKNFPSRWNRAQTEPLEGLLTPEQMKDLDDAASVSKAINFDANPSGSGKLLQKSGEMMSVPAAVAGGLTQGVLGHPVAGAVTAALPVAGMAAEHAIAKRLVNPEATAQLMTGARPTAAQAFADAAKNFNPARGAAVGAAAEAGNQESAADRWRQLNAETPQAAPAAPQPVPAPALENTAPQPQAGASAPEGATHEVLHPDGQTVLGHVVNGEYVPLENQSGSEE